MSALTNSGTPIAATRISAMRVMAGKSRVREWHTVTVALAPAAFCIKMAASGFPTIFDRPTMTTCFPEGSNPERTSKAWQPAGVQGRKPGSPESMRPTLTG